MVQWLNGLIVGFAQPGWSDLYGAGRSAAAIAIKQSSHQTIKFPLLCTTKF
jgi:hypothetical protein